MIRLAVFDNDDENRKALKNIIIRYTTQRNIDFDVLWFFKCFSSEKIKKLTSLVNIAIISSEFDSEYQISKAVYENNENCRIIYYSSSVTDLEPMLSVRTRAFHLAERGDEALISQIDNILEELKRSNNNFYFETRRDIFAIPYSNILYFQSDLKYVIINMESSTERIYSKLADVEKLLGDDFLRIHKSYIVNVNFISRIDKSTKSVMLNNGESLPISDINYKTVINSFGK